MFESNASVVFPICRFLRNSDLVIHLLITFENLEAYFYQADAEKISPKQSAVTRYVKQMSIHPIEERSHIRLWGWSCFYIWLVMQKRLKKCSVKRS